MDKKKPLKIQINGKEYNCSNIVFWHIEGLKAENRVLNHEIKGLENKLIEQQRQIERYKKELEK